MLHKSETNHDIEHNKINVHSKESFSNISNHQCISTEKKNALPVVSIIDYALYNVRN